MSEPDWVLMNKHISDLEAEIARLRRQVIERIYIIPERGRVKYPFDDMRAGDKLWLPEERVNSCLTAARAWVKRNDAKLRFERGVAIGEVIAHSLETDNA